VLDEVYEKWDQYKYFGLNCPTGTGKTYIATALAAAAGRAYILTSTLQLQDQYQSSWDTLISLKGRGNYACNINPAFTVDAAPCTASQELYKSCRVNRTCAYYNQRDAAIAAPAMITNPLYLLYSNHCGFAATGEDPWVKRDVLIVDEAHNLENHLVQFAESDVDPEKLALDFGVMTKHFQFTGRPEEDYLMVVKIQAILMAKAQEFAAEIENAFPQRNLFDGDYQSWARGITEKAAEKVRKLQVRANMLDKTIQPLKIFFNTHSTPEELTRRWIVSKYADKNVLKLSPIYGDFLFHIYFGDLADKFVFLSATLGTKSAFCKEIGAEPEQCLFIETDSPFDPKRSPIIVMPAIKLSKDKYDENVKKVGGIVEDIMKLHPGQRGIIHCIKGTTLINMSDGSRKSISRVQQFDKVSSWNQEEKLFESSSVLATINNGIRECVELTFDNGKTLTCTPDHLILTERGWVEAERLLESDEILDDSSIPDITQARRIYPR
jgi:Rad3-related DNA helicase